MKLYTLCDTKPTTGAELGNVEFSIECDILCVGAGASGVYAAESAAGEGADVILLESSTCIGGTHVRGNVCSYYYGDTGGAYLDTDRKCDRRVFLAGNQQPETKQVLLYKRLTQKGVKILCRHTPIGVYMADTRVMGLRVLTDKGIISIKAKFIIDSTGDGHIIRMCPVKKYYGRKADGKTVPFTVRTQFFTKGLFKSINTDSGYTNQYDKHDFSRKTILAHANSAKYIDKGDFINVAYLTGIREGLSFEGEETIGYRSIIMKEPWKKVLFYAYSDLDKHGYDFALDEELFQNWFVISNLSTVTMSIAVPLGCVVPKDLKGIVTAGRCLSADSYSMSSIRMNRDMFRMGECVGIAAAMAVKDGCDFTEIDYEQYVQKVTRRGCFKSGTKFDYGFDNPNPSRAFPYTPVNFGVEKNLKLLETSTPGVAIWSCFISDEGKNTSEIVYNKLMTCSGPLTKYNCAIALGIMGDARAVPILCDIIRNRDSFRFNDCRRTNQLRTSIAICLLGRLGTKQDALLLEDIVFGENEHERAMYRRHTIGINGYYNPVYFDVFTHACMALAKLYKAHGMDLALLGERFEKLFEGGKIIKRVTSAQYGEPEFMEIYDFQKVLLKYVPE